MVIAILTALPDELTRIVFYKKYRVLRFYISFVFFFEEGSDELSVLRIITIELAVILPAVKNSYVNGLMF